MSWNVAVIPLCSLLLVFLLWKEAKRLNKSWLAARIIASALAVAGLACLALPVSVGREKKRSSSSVTILLTEGFSKDSVQAFLNAEKDAVVFTTDKNITAFYAKYIPGADEFSAPSYNSNPLHVFGYGITKTEIADLQNTPVIFHPAVVQNTITSIGWTQTIYLGEQLIVQGSFINAKASPVKLLLSGFDAHLDSIIISAKGSSYFQLSGMPKHLGRAVYSITILSGKDTIENESIPIEVKSTEPLRLLLLAASPDFENKFLKGWLAQEEYGFAVRTSISQNKYDRQYANMPSISLDHITPALLDRFDVVIADASELSAIASADIAAIRNAVENKGMGLIVKADSIGSSSSFYAGLFPLSETRDSIQHIVRLNLTDTSHQLSPLKIEQPVYIRSVSGTQALVKDAQQHTLASSKLYGAGKVVLTTVPNSYSWQLAGNTGAYSSYWSWLLQKAAKKVQSSQILAITPALPQKDEEASVQVQTINDNIPQLQAGEALLYPQQQYGLPYEWNGSYWPVKTGWQSLLVNRSPTWWYVYSNNDWSGVKAAEKINATKVYERNHINNPVKNQTTAITETVPVPKIYFLVLFVICSGVLWAEKKFSGD